jgi:hypothetical protein
MSRREEVEIEIGMEAGREEMGAAGEGTRQNM